MNPLIGIVTVLYNSESVLEDFFKSLDKQTYSRFILYVVDNKSPDNSLLLTKSISTRSLFKIIVIENSSNYGVAKGNNIGIQRALNDGCDLILLSNNDVVLNSDTIEVLLNGLTIHKAGIAVPKIYYHDTNIIWTAGGYFHKRSGLNIHRGNGEIDNGQYQNDELMTFSPTCFMLIKKELFSTVGMMDERYFVYWDDTDFIYRSMKQNEKLWYIPKSIVYHKESTSTGLLSDFSIRYQYRNLVYFAFKNYSRLYALYVISYNFFYLIYKHAFRWPFKKLNLGLRSFFEGVKYYYSNGSY